MTLHEIRTDLAPREVIDRARSFFPLAGTPYAAFPDPAAEGFLRLRLEVGEVVIAAVRKDGSTRVRASATRGGHLLTHFLTTLAPPLDAKRTVYRDGVRATHGAAVEVYADPAAILPQAA